MKGLGSFIISALLCALSLWACGVKMSGARAVSEGDFPCDESVDCPAADSPCLLSQCYDGQCVFVPSPPGTLPESDQVVGDCKQLTCDGDGNTTTVAARYDLPADDGNPCTDAVCDLDVPKRSAKDAGAPCNKGGLCNGSGKCGVCLPGKERCEGHATASCNDDGQWSEASACSSATPVCANAACQAVVEVDTGAAHGCARFADGHVRCWGQTGAAPQALPWIAPGDRVAVGARHACRLRGSQVACWGANDFGQLGAGSYVSSATPVVALSDSVSQVAVGRNHTCALTNEGKVLCWGRNDHGQLGSGKAPPKMLAAGVGAIGGGSSEHTPRPLDGVSATNLMLDGHLSCFSQGNALRCLGLRPYLIPATLEPAEGETPEPAVKKLIDERSKATIVTPTLVVLEGATQLASGSTHSCARLKTGKVSCWGAGHAGALGKGTRDAFRPVAVPGVADAQAIKLGNEFSCAVLGSGLVHCWGANARGQLGRGSLAKSGKPGLVNGLGAVDWLGVGAGFACALTREKRVLCWGEGGTGALGNGKPVDAAAPTPVVW